MSDMSQFVREVIDKARRELPQVKFLSGTFTGYGSEPGSQEVYAYVHVPGDDPGDTRQVEVLTSDALTPGQGILLMYVPPEGAYLLAAVSAPALPTARLTDNCTGGVDFGVLGLVYTTIPFCCAEHQDGAADPITGVSAGVRVEAGGLYSIGLQTTLKVTAPTTAVGVLLADVRVTDPVSGYQWQVGRWRRAVSATSDVLETATVAQSFYVPPGGTVSAGVAHTVNVNGAGAAASTVYVETAGSILSVAPVGGRTVTPTLCGPGL